MSGVEIKCDRCLARIRDARIGTNVFYISKLRLCRPCAEQTVRDLQGAKPAPLDTRPYDRQGNTLAPAKHGEPVMNLSYMTQQQVKDYIRTWLLYVSKQSMSQPRHFVRQRALPPPSGSPK